MKDITSRNTKQRHLAYIMSPSYSGSTLLTLFLADHPDIATVGELKATSMGDITTYNCSCGELLTVCPFWGKVQQAMREQGKTLDLANYQTHFHSPKHPIINRLLRAGLRTPLFEAARSTGFCFSPTARAVKKSILAQNQALIEIICNLQQGQTFLDDSKDPIRLKFFVESNIWDVRVIHLIRDGRGVTNSFMRHQKMTMAEAAREWVHTQNECNRMTKQLNENHCLTVYYETLCREPEKTLATIHRFLGLEPSFIPPPDRTKHIMGNQMRLDSLQDIRIDEKWKKAHTQDDLQIFMNLAGELNNLHGYK
jgi:hypothetical protein